MAAKPPKGKFYRSLKETLVLSGCHEYLRIFRAYAPNHKTYQLRLRFSAEDFQVSLAGPGLVFCFSFQLHAGWPG